MLSFAIEEPDGIIEIFFDTEGRDQLIGMLNAISAPGVHDHLMTPSWGGNELDEILFGANNRRVYQVNIGIPR